MLRLSRKSNEDLKVLIAFHASQMGGAELATIELAKGLSDSGVKVFAVLPNDGPAVEELKKLNIEHSIIPFISWARDHIIKENDLAHENYVNTRAVENIYRYIKNIRPDVVISETITNPWPALAASAAKVPCIWQIHEYGDKGYVWIFDYPYEQIMQIIDNFSNLIVVNSVAVSQHIEKYFSKGKIQQVYSYAPDENPPQAETIFENDQAIKLLVLGKFVASKGQLDVLEALKILQDENLTEIELALVGRSKLDDEKYVEELEKFIKQNKLVNVKILPYINNPIAAILSSDLVITPSVDEAFGRATAEAMSHGRLVIGASSGGTKELLENNRGILYQPGNGAQLAEAVKKAISQKKAGKKMIKNARKFAKKNFSQKKYIGQMIRIIKTASELKPKDQWFLEKIIPTYAQITDDDKKKIDEIRDRAEKLSKS